MVLYCDKCNKELDQREHNFNTIAIDIWDYDGSGEVIFCGELCNECLKKLNKLLNNKLEIYKFEDYFKFKKRKDRLCVEFKSKKMKKLYEKKTKKKL